MGVLNQELSLEEVRYLIGSQVSRLNGYDVALSFRGAATKTLLRAKATRLFRLVRLSNGQYFDGAWWMTQRVFDELLQTTADFDKGGGAYLRNLIRDTLSLPGSPNQLCVVRNLSTTLRHLPAKISEFRLPPAGRAWAG